VVHILGTIAPYIRNKPDGGNRIEKCFVVIIWYIFNAFIISNGSAFLDYFKRFACFIDYVH
jgi:hypothetical protein